MRDPKLAHILVINSCLRLKTINLNLQFVSNLLTHTLVLPSKGTKAVAHELQPKKKQNEQKTMLDAKRAQNLG